MNLLYPRCGVLALQGQTVFACLRIQEMEGPAYEEVRSFAVRPEELATLSDWLSTHGVTYVGMESTDRAWKPIYQALQKACTVLLLDARRVTDVKDLGRIASLLAYGLEPCRVAPPMSGQESTPRSRRKLITVGAMLILTALLASYGVWQRFGLIAPATQPVPTTSRTVRWQQAVVSHQYPAVKPFSFSLPELERSPEGIPVDVGLDAAGDSPSWLQFDRESLALQGVAPPSAQDQTYRLIMRARTAQGSDSQLLVLLTITGQAAETPSPPRLPGHWSW